MPSSGLKRGKERERRGEMNCVWLRVVADMKRSNQLLLLFFFFLLLRMVHSLDTRGLARIQEAAAATNTTAAAVEKVTGGASSGGGHGSSTGGTDGGNADSASSGSGYGSATPNLQGAADHPRNDKPRNKNDASSYRLPLPVILTAVAFSQLLLLHDIYY
ncbi:hypothetical protein C4D60_Mb06t19460 [Musa balbisiana]|uniref:Uncharacterized protein n=1 Tax=Musa balbisiana TaxID=52838 RepID=A0A4V4H410_MUSBA|nr:hypothetical protein C4D60_Mb06t19460 [Musa balbisiana]